VATSAAPVILLTAHFVRWITKLMPESVLLNILTDFSVENFDKLHEFA
jgi:hypothetical protein